MNRHAVSAFVRSRLFAGILAGIGLTLIALCIFQAGIAVGYHEAAFSSQWGKNYARNFGGSDMGLDVHEPNPHGTIGRILSISRVGTTTTLVIYSPDRPEQKVEIDTDTSIRNAEKTVPISSLSVGTYTVILGMPNDEGVLDAKLIRIIPAPPALPIAGTRGTTSSPYAAP